MANTAGLTTNFNIDPYYDDYSEDKGYYRILFKPGLAVQARELTQMQTMTQKQISRFADHVFKDGTIVQGGQPVIDYDYQYIKIPNRDSANVTINVANLMNRSLVHAPSGLSALVVNVLDGDENTANTKTLYVKYTNSGSSQEKFFANGNTITANNGISFTVPTIADSTGKGCAVTVDAGVIYAKEHFVAFPSQTLIIGRYNTTPTVRVGFLINEEIVTAQDDISLTDPANGSPNYAAPGADRLKLDAVLTALQPRVAAPEFRQLYEIFNGVIQNSYDQKTVYSDIAKESAKRTFQESGNYVVSGLAVGLYEHLDTGNNNGIFAANDSIIAGNNFKLVATVDPGESYVEGYYFKNIITQNLHLDKGIQTANVESQVVGVGFGNYVRVNEVSGFWDLQENAVVNLYQTAQDRVSRGVYSTSSALLGSSIGTAKFKQIKYVSGFGAAAEYYIYLSDIKMTGGSFASVRSLYVDNSTRTDAYADTILEGGATVLKEAAIATSLMRLPVQGVKTLRDSVGDIETTYTCYRNYDVTVATNGQFTVSTGSNNIVYTASGVQTNLQKSQYYLVLHNNANTANLTGTITVTAASNTVTGSGTSFTTTVNVGDVIVPNSSAEALVVSAVANNTSLSIATAANTSQTANTFYKRFFQGAVINLQKTGSNVNITSSTSASFNINETLLATANATLIAPFVKINAQEKKKTLRRNRYVKIYTANNSANTVGPYYLGHYDIFRVNSIRLKTGSDFASASEGSNVTSQFRIFTGDDIDLYSHGRIERNGITLGATDYLLVDFDHFEHDGSQGLGYFSIDSYPIDDANTANTAAIQTKEIPVITDSKRGGTYDLRDYIDFRAAETATANSATTLANATFNPPRSNTFVTVSSRLDYPVVGTQFQADLSYYLPRKDVVYVNKDGTFSIVYGRAAETPITPVIPENSMALATIRVAPFPSLSREEAAFYNRPGYANEITNISNRRYTMRDIGVLDKRISNLEYYVSLSLLEKETMSLKITDANGLDRFKNGILVDSFSGHNVGNVDDPDYRIAVDPKARELRPAFELDNVRLVPSSFNNTTDQAIDIVVTCNNTVSVIDAFAAPTLTGGDYVYQGANTSSKTASGYVRYRMNSKLNIEVLSGTFTTGDLKKDTSLTTNSGNNYTISITSIRKPNPGKYVTLLRSNTVAARQPYATASRKVNGLDFNWVGKIDFRPSNFDSWVDTQTNPQLNVNIDNNYDNWQKLTNAYGTSWGSWQTTWTGQTSWSSNASNYSVGSTQIKPHQLGYQVWDGGDVSGGSFGGTITTTVESRVGTKLTATQGQVENQSLGQRVTDVALSPYMRTRILKFRGYGLKPNTRFYAFFDSVDVNEYCASVSSAYYNSNDYTLPNSGTISGDGFTLGSTLTSDSAGNLYGVFVLPNNESLRFTVGTKMFRLTDNAQNLQGGTDVTSSAEIDYTASGLVQQKQETVLSTRPVSFITDTLSETRTLTDRSIDYIEYPPAAETVPVYSNYYNFEGDVGGGCGPGSADGKGGEGSQNS